MIYIAYIILTLSVLNCIGLTYIFIMSLVDDLRRNI